jgi:hypothetical protein
LEAELKVESKKNEKERHGKYKEERFEEDRASPRKLTFGNDYDWR